MSAVILESNGKLRLPYWAVRLGNASHAIYLVHFSAIVVLSRLVARLAAAHRAPLEDILCLGIAAGGVVCGVAFDRIVDRPLQARLRFRSSDRTQSALGEPVLL